MEKWISSLARLITQRTEETLFAGYRSWDGERMEMKMNWKRRSQQTFIKRMRIIGDEAFSHFSDVHKNSMNSFLSFLSAIIMNSNEMWNGKIAKFIWSSLVEKMWKKNSRECLRIKRKSSNLTWNLRRETLLSVSIFSDHMKHIKAINLASRERSKEPENEIFVFFMLEWNSSRPHTIHISLSRSFVNNSNSMVVKKLFIIIINKKNERRRRYSRFL